MPLSLFAELALPSRYASMVRLPLAAIAVRAICMGPAAGTHKAGGKVAPPPDTCLSLWCTKQDVCVPGFLLLFCFCWFGVCLSATSLRAVAACEVWRAFAARSHAPPLTCHSPRTVRRWAVARGAGLAIFRLFGSAARPLHTARTPLRSAPASRPRLPRLLVASGSWWWPRPPGISLGSVVARFQRPLCPGPPSPPSTAPPARSPPGTAQPPQAAPDPGVLNQSKAAARPFHHFDLVVVAGCNLLYLVEFAAALVRNRSHSQHV